MCAQLPIARLHRASLHFSPSALGCFISSDRFVYLHFITPFGWNPAYCDSIFDLYMVTSRHLFGLNLGEASTLDLW